jgi:hypothetical protein
MSKPGDPIGITEDGDTVYSISDQSSVSMSVSMKPTCNDFCFIIGKDEDEFLKFFYHRNDINIIYTNYTKQR